MTTAMLIKKHFIGAGLQFQRFSPLLSWWNAWQYTGRNGAENKYIFICRQKTV
ncbi:hypothetical protein I79_015390 [Cricetulus griseus]|uniref:Uncharacterized protein n=1 Tax=Cricetulus griseus TaxID=10029 RepID=G3HWN1_CRIGR|nr:hypothetical protein I79_015390 [Cricetulus griseus]